MLKATVYKTLRSKGFVGYGDADPVTLSEALAAGNAVYGKTFNVMVALKALTYFEDGNLPNLSVTVQEQLRKTALEVKLDRLPQTVGRPGITRRDSSR